MEGIACHLILKGKPYSVNQAYARGPSRGRGKTNFYMRPEAKQYKESIGWQARIQFKKRPFHQHLEVIYHYYFGDQRVHDHGNFNKGLNDALEQIIWRNDKQILVSHHYTFWDFTNPRVELFIKILDEDYHKNHGIV